ncbi:MAG: hypothetical protein ABI667_10265 [Sphingomicrobium sp.]
MNTPIEQYRELAAKAHEEAAASELPQVKARCLRSAEHFENLVMRLESVASAKMRNEAARAESPGSETE